MAPGIDFERIAASCEKPRELAGRRKMMSTGAFLGETCSSCLTIKQEEWLTGTTDRFPVGIMRVFDSGKHLVTGRGRGCFLVRGPRRRVRVEAKVIGRIGEEGFICLDEWRKTVAGKLLYRFRPVA